MRCPTLKELPPPCPQNKTGWPWTEESPQLPDAMPDGSTWPKISIITPSLNQEQFIEETIRSVLLQGYPNLEYIIIDGGSKDGSVDIIKKYEHWMSYWASEPDRGQSHAINKGLAKSKCDIFTWLNSDDIYLPNALASSAYKFHVTGEISIIAGNILEFGDLKEGEQLITQREITFRNMVEFWNKRDLAWHQPALFFPKKKINEVGKLDETLSYLMDYDLLCRLLQTSTVEYIDEVLVKFRLHTASKTCSRQASFRKEMSRISHRYWNLIPDLNKTSAYFQVIHFLVTTAIYEFRKANFKESLDLFKESFRIKPRLTIEAIIREIFRLTMGGKFTGRTLM